MKNLRILIVAAALVAMCAGSAFAAKPGSGPVVVLETSMGNIMLMLDSKQAPKSVENFLSYVDEGFYDGTVFHRVIDGFMVQGGGYEQNMIRKETKSPILNEADNGLNNARGTVAFARTAEVDSATSQFFINLVDNDFLNHRDKSARGYGYAVFGRVIRGMDVVDKIAKVETGRRGGMGDVPLETVTITKAYRHEG